MPRLDDAIAARWDTRTRLPRAELAGHLALWLLAVLAGWANSDTPPIAVLLAETALTLAILANGTAARGPRSQHAAASFADWACAVVLYTRTTAAMVQMYEALERRMAGGARPDSIPLCWVIITVSVLRCAALHDPGAFGAGSQRSQRSQHPPPSRTTSHQ